MRTRARADTASATAPRLLLALLALLAPAPAPARADSLYDRTGQQCDFENSTDPGCGWTWGHTGHGFRVVTGQEIASLQTTVKGLTGPTTDANNNTQGHFLFLNAQPDSPEPEHLISPAYMFTASQCALRVSLHTASGSIAVFAESQQSNGSSFPWVLASNVTNSGSAWQTHNISIGRVAQTIRIVIEVTNVTRSAGHVAIDNLQLVRCFHGKKLKDPEKCNAKSHFNCSTGECIAHSHVCDLMKDCPLGEDEAAEAHCFEVPRSARCDFERDMCNFTASRLPNEKSKIEWTRISGETLVHKRAQDHTSNGNASGMYLYVKSDGVVGSAALLDSAIFNPPPPCHRNESSRFKNSCEIRFFYHQFGPHSGSFAVTVNEFWPRNKVKPHQIFWNYGDKKSIWTQVLIIMPPIIYKYQIHMEARRGLRASDLALDDFTLSPECFGLGIPKEELGNYDYATAGKVDEPTKHAEHHDFVNKTMYRFTTCGAKGMAGPNQTLCASFYNGTSTNVTVLDPQFPGVQRWVVPETGPYTVIARGAGGGSGSEGKGWSLAAEARTVLELKSGDSLYILVGQEGTSTCRKGDDDKGECRSPFNPPRSGDFRKQLQYVDNTTGGGGGGGGASFVFTKGRARNSKPQPLLVAAGGGGLGNSGQGGHGMDDERQHGHGANDTRPGTAGVGIGPQPAGPGGGWFVSNVTDHAGLSLLQGGLGGRGCRNSTSGKGDGGFGGGGGGCAAGGGGGGYSGGNAWSERFYHGEGGYSKVLDGAYRQVTPMVHDGDGEVIIIPGIKGCDCQYHCAALNEQRSLVQCVCPPGQRINGKTCKTEGQDIADYLVLALVAVVVFLIILFSVVAIYTYNKFQKRKEMSLRRKTPSGADLQLRNLRNDLMTETNPNYEFAGERYTLKDLRDVPREHLRLTRALGQGAFGEVYEGLYKMRPGDAVEMPVAVKTLPELSTLQAENDFMLEALIMGKFNHPNIVHLIGVCFDKHPRYIVLELLSGGDLKTFLRESRPRSDRPSPLNMRDLLMCCVDVAKGCKYLEENRFIHRDIAARNCLLTAKTPGRIVKIADFGMAREVYMSDYYRKGGKAMLPIKWMPPEAFLDGIFTTKTDVWSYGVLLWEVMSLGYMPYTGCANRNVMSLVVSGGRLEPPPNCPPSVYAIMTACWHPEPPQRPDFASILENLTACLQDPDTLATPLKPIAGLSESGLQIRYNRDFEAISKSLALAHGWLFDGKDADVLTSPPALSVAPSASTELSNLSSPVDQEAAERMERSPTADYLVPMPLAAGAGPGTGAVTPSHVVLPSAPPVPHRPPLGPAPAPARAPPRAGCPATATAPLRPVSTPLLELTARDAWSPGPGLGPGSLLGVANGKAVPTSANPLPLDPALLVRPNPKLRTEADGAPSPIADAEITC